MSSPFMACKHIPVNTQSTACGMHAFIKQPCSAARVEGAVLDLSDDVQGLMAVCTHAASSLLLHYGD